MNLNPHFWSAEFKRPVKFWLLIHNVAFSVQNRTVVYSYMNDGFYLYKKQKKHFP